MAAPRHVTEEGGVGLDGARRAEQFEALYRATKGPLSAYVLRRCGPSEAADVLAETYAIAWRRQDQIPDGRAGLLWLYVTARHVVANGLRARQRQGVVLDRLAAELAGRVQAPAQGEAVAAIEVLDRLDPDDRELLMLIAWDGLSTTEAARVQGCSPVALRIRLHRARRRLESLLSSASGPGAASPANVRLAGTPTPGGETMT